MARRTRRTYESYWMLEDAEDETQIDLNALSMPTLEKQVTVTFPKQEFSYKENFKPSRMTKDYIIGNEITGTPLQIFQQIYNSYQNERVKNNILRVKKEKDVIFLLGKNIIFANRIPVLVVLRVYKEGNISDHKIFIGAQLLQMPNPTAKHILQKVVPQFVGANYSPIIVDMKDWVTEKEKYVHRTEDISKLLLDNIDDIYANGI